MRKLFSPKRLISLVTLIAFLATSSSALAYFERRNVLGDSTPSAKTKEKVQRKLTDAKLKICRVREAGIKLRSINSTIRAKGLAARLERHVQAAKKFYTSVLLPAGKIVDNYDQLLASIETKKAAAQAAFQTADQTARAFDCKGDDPKGQLATFRSNMEKAMTALKDYKSAVKDLLKALREANVEDRANLP